MPPENNDEDFQDGMDLGINTEEELLLKILCLCNSILQKREMPSWPNNNVARRGPEYVSLSSKKKSMSKPSSRKYRSCMPSRTQYNPHMAP
jgi:hypothetical protein